MPIAPFQRLAAEAVTFAYPGAARPSLLDVDVEIRAGEIIALVGENGSGKTTLAKVLCGLYEPSGGAVTWDGADLATLDPAAVRQQLTVIFQDFVRYSLTLRENITLGRPEAAEDEERMLRAAGLADVSRIAARLDDGFDTRLGREFGRSLDLSGGQWQRVALARAFFRDAPFLVLDEPTAALDARAEHDLFQRIRALAAGRSVLLITHRFGNVRSADRIYVLHRGKVVEQGSHDDLMSQHGRYADLFTLQASAYLDPTSPPA